MNENLSEIPEEGSRELEQTRPVAPIHEPSRRQAILFLVLMIAAAAGIVAWVFFFNKGTLMVSGAAPFTIRAGGQAVKCEASPCSVTLKAQKYLVSISKDGFRDAKEEVTVPRRGEISISPAFGFIPVLSDEGPVVLPFENAPLNPLFIGKTEIKNLPKNARRIEVGRNNFLLLVFDRQATVYDILVRPQAGVPKSVPTISWLADALIYLEKSEEQENLYYLNFMLKQEPTIVATFERPFNNPKLFGQEWSHDFVLIRDGQESAYNYYLVDMGKSSRTRLNIPATARFIKWVEDKMIFEEKDATYMVDAVTKVKTDLDIESGDHMTPKEPGIYLVMTPTKYGENNSMTGPSIAEVIEQAAQETQEAFSPVDTGVLYLSLYNSQKGTYETVLEVPVTESEKIERLTYDAATQNAYFIKGGKLFKVQFSPESL